ncbi:Maf family protein [Humitalea sp. 24SJ18S-53]|uniref:Maf family protein n=1 Tax=Humitalea sp. 24SJ18S-53 TaxID=3422307 RepID=UPI003D67B24B
MIQAEDPPILLASASASRAGLLRASGLVFEARAAHVDEDALKAAALAEGMPVADTALMLADAKARRLAMRDPNLLVIGGDQMLVCGDDRFDKPADLAAARAQLMVLRGKTHMLPTAIVVWRHGRRIWHHVATPRMTMRQFSDAVLDAYLAAEGDAVLASVGGYRVEGPGIQLFERIEGSQDEILGLPILPLLGFLRQHGVLAG